MKPTFESTVDILVKAYLNDTLRHGSCHACAVGNMISHKMGIRYQNYKGWVQWSESYPEWDNVFYTGDHPAVEDAQIINMTNYYGESKIQIDSTGYTVEELARIEKSFEAHNPSYFLTNEVCKIDKVKDEWMFKGLMAVIDTLADIHEIELQAKESAKALFVKSCA